MVRGAGTLSRVRKLWEDSARMVTEGETSVELPFGHLPAAIPVKNTSYELLNSTFLQTRIPNFYSHFKEKKQKTSINVDFSHAYLREWSCVIFKHLWHSKVWQFVNQT